MEKLTEVLKWLTDRGYALSAGKGKYSFSVKFYDQLKTEAIIIQMSAVPRLELTQHGVVEHGISLLPEVKEMYPTTIEGLRYSDLFIHFIAQSEIPAKSEDTRGNLYPINKYNDKAAAVLYKLVSSGQVDYLLLVKSTMLYYKSGKKFKKTIGNYITEGDWRTDYEALKLSASQGEEALKNHIKEETKDESGYSGYTLG